MFRNRSKKFRPQVNALEARDCPAVMCTLNGGNLLILGDQGNNSVAITTSATGVVDAVAVEDVAVIVVDRPVGEERDGRLQGRRQQGRDRAP